MYLLIARTISTTTLEKNNDNEVITELKPRAGLSAALEPSAPAVFRALIAEAEVCKRIVIDGDWTAVDGREEVMDDPESETQTIRTRTRSILAKNGLTKVNLGEVVGPGRDELVIATSIATKQEPQAAPLKIALQVEFAQWARFILNTTEFREITDKKGVNCTFLFFLTEKVIHLFTR